MHGHGKKTPYSGAFLNSVVWVRKCWIISGDISRAGMGMGAIMVPESSMTNEVDGGVRVGVAGGRSDGQWGGGGGRAVGVRRGGAGARVCGPRVALQGSGVGVGKREG